jgi:hypothetical protein
MRLTVWMENEKSLIQFRAFRHQIRLRSSTTTQSSITGLRHKDYWSKTNDAAHTPQKALSMLHPQPVPQVHHALNKSRTLIPLTESDLEPETLAPPAPPAPPEPPPLSLQLRRSVFSISSAAVASWSSRTGRSAGLLSANGVANCDPGGPLACIRGSDGGW